MQRRITAALAAARCRVVGWVCAQRELARLRAEVARLEVALDEERATVVVIPESYMMDYRAKR